MKRLPMKRREARRRLVDLIDSIYDQPEFLRACDAAINAMTLVQMAVNLEQRAEEEAKATRGGYSPQQYVRLKKCARCGHARFQHRKDSLRGDSCLLCECDGWSTVVDEPHTTG